MGNMPCTTGGGPAGEFNLRSGALFRVSSPRFIRAENGMEPADFRFVPVVTFSGAPIIKYNRSGASTNWLGKLCREGTSAR